ncbi:MAG: DNA (cytosine-5-)-methyltransferase [Actinomycetota bacterium]|nr:DNA (cytosine-5-)-methyltransferase [Actinomycetota bacterium]
MRELTFISLYSGAGGMDLGFARAGFVPRWANDIDPFAVKTYNSAFSGDGLGDTSLAHQSTCGDILGQLWQLDGVEADLVIGGPPCQGFSVAGKMDPEDPRSMHVRHFMDVVEKVRPRAFVMENVKSLAVNPRWSGTRAVLIERAEQLGYSTRMHVLNSSHFDVPQTRERMFLVGLLTGMAHADPSPVTAHNPPTVRQLLASLPPLGEPGNAGGCPARITLAKRPVLRRSPYAGLLFNGKGRVLNLDAPAPTLPATMGGNRTPIIDQRALEDGKPDWILEYHDHLMRGGKPLASAPPFLRRLTVEEAAAIQTFPPTMVWHGAQTAIFRQIGNAVPPNLAYHVALAVKASLVS